MKKILLALAVVLLTTAVGAQNVNKTALLQKIEKAEAATADAKKATKAATWITLAKAYVDAAVEPTKDLQVGMMSMMLQSFGQPKSNSQATIAGTELAVLTFDYVTVYLREGVAGWKQIAEVTPDPIGKALAALDKAYELDPKQASKIRTELVRISNFCIAQGDALNNIEQYAASSEAFETAFRAESNPAFGQPDLTRLYNAGAVATVGGAENPELFARAEKLLAKALEMGFEDDKGMIYYFLYHAYYGQRETEPAKLQKAKGVLLLGLQKHGDNEMLQESLITLYTTVEGMGDPRDLITGLDERIAADPENIELWFNRAQIFVKLKEYDQAVASLDHAITLDPNSYTAQFFAGYYLIAKADAMNDASNAKDYGNDYEQMNLDRKAVLAVYAQAVPYLERAHEIDPTQSDPVALLSPITFQLRETNADMMAKFNKYKALADQMSE